MLSSSAITHKTTTKSILDLKNLYDHGHLNLEREKDVKNHFPQLVLNILAQKIVDDLDAALEQFRLIANDLGNDTSEKVT